ncbi:TPA: POTRA domain-containing protein [Serratia fonticola]
MDSVTQRLAVSLLFLSLSAGVSANMLSPADRDTIQQQQRELLQQNQQQRQELQRSLTPVLPQTPAATAPGGPCFTINNVRFEGANLLPASARQALTQSYLQRYLNLSQINTLVQQVSDWYIERGYITSRAFL